MEAMLFCTTAALQAADEVRAALHEGSNHDPSTGKWQECAQTILDGVQVLAHQAAALSRYLWPARQTEPHDVRARRLREGLCISPESPLKNRELRNTLEHFDEHLDEFCGELAAGMIYPTYVGPMPEASEVPTYRFRAYYTDSGVFEILGHRWELQPVLDELVEMHQRLMRCAEAGGRLPSRIDH